ncbi:MAG: O-antigen ligase family protein [Candidatus Sumerlaeaceae bacterium]
MSISRNANSQNLRTPLLTALLGAGVAALLALSPQPIRHFGLFGLMGMTAGVFALFCTAVHPLLPFALYFGALFFADTKVAGLPLSMGQGLGLLFLLSFGAYVVRGRAMALPSKFLPVLSTVAVYFTIRAITGEDLERSLIHFRYVVIYFVVAVALAASMTTERAILAFCWIIVGLTAVAAVHGLWQAVEKDILGAFRGHWGSANRVRGTAKNPIVFGWNMVFSFPFAFFLYAQLKSQWTRTLALVLGLLCIFAATFTFNRQTYVLIALLVVMAGTMYRYHGRKLLLSAIVVMGGLATVTVLPLVLARFSTVATLSKDYSFLERRDSFLLGMQMFEQHPIFGVGLGSFPAVWKNYLPQDYSTYFVQYMTSTELRYPDFGYLNLLAEGGVVGVSLFVFMLFAWLRGAWGYRKRAIAAGDKLAQNLSTTVLLLGVFLALSSAIQDTFLYTRVWVALALVLLIDERILPIRPEDDPYLVPEPVP